MLVYDTDITCCTDAELSMKDDTNYIYRISSITATINFVSLLVFLRLLFEGGVYFFEKPADIYNGWIRYVQVIQRRLLDAVSSSRSLSSAVSRGNESYRVNEQP